MIETVILLIVIVVMLSALIYFGIDSLLILDDTKRMQRETDKMQREIAAAQDRMRGTS